MKNTEQNELRFDYFYGNEQEQYLFLQMPLLLVREKTFKYLSGDAKILYTLYMNRVSLSKKNNWIDKQGRIYIIYTIENIMEDLNCAREKAVNLMNELRDIGLIETVRRGLGQANFTYVMNYATELKYSLQDKKAEENSQNTQTFDHRTSENPENTQTFDNRTCANSIIENQSFDDRTPDVRKSNGSNIESNNIEEIKKEEKNNTEDRRESMSLSESLVRQVIDQVMTQFSENLINQVQQFENKTYENFKSDINNIQNQISEIRVNQKEMTDRTLTRDVELSQANNIQQNEKKPPQIEMSSQTNDLSESLHHYDSCTELIQQHISYESFLQSRVDIGLVNNFVACIVETVSSKNTQPIRINGEEKDREIVKSVFMKLNYDHIQHAIDQYKSRYNKIVNKRNYIRVLLYNTYHEMSAHYRNQYNVDRMNG